MDVENKLKEFVDAFLPKGFVWRKGQKEAITEIIKTYEEGRHKVIILDSPVGSGKSLIALVVSWILNEKNKRGFILASDISLQEQYERDLERFNIQWGSVKGIDNYLCIDNMEKNSLGTCRIRNRRPISFPCYDECPYFSARDRAAGSPTALLNYAYWLVQMNYVNTTVEQPPFPKRDFLVCDEGHKVLDIVQNHYTPRFNDVTVEKIEKLTDFFNLHRVKDHTENSIILKKCLKAIKREDNQDNLFKVLDTMEKNLRSYLGSVKALKDRVKKEYPKSAPPREWRKALRLSDWVKDLHCKVEDYVDIISSTSTRNIVKNPQGEGETIFNCLEENYMMKKYFHRWSDFTILMSATFSDIPEYVKSIYVNSAKYIKIDNHFDFSRSPIYFQNKRRLSYKQMEANLPWLYDRVNEILDKHGEDNGIIHTVSYDLTMKINQHLNKRNRKRVLLYNGTKEKREMLDVLKRGGGKVLMGPSLMEGIDLKDDWSRLQIFCKIPYPSLGDKFTKTKMELNPNWYRMKTILNVIQGVGRSIRNENDWAVTYILDGSLSDLLHRNRNAFPLEFIQRIKIMDG